MNQGAICARLLPTDALRLKMLTTKAFDSSRKDMGFCNRHLVAPITAITSIVLAILQIPVYTTRAVLNTIMGVVNLNGKNELGVGKEDFESVLSLTVYTLLSITFIFASIVCPTWALSYYMPAEKPMKAKEIFDLEGIRVDLSSKDEKIKGLEEKIRLLQKGKGTSSKDRIAQLEEQIRILKEGAVTNGGDQISTEALRTQLLEAEASLTEAKAQHTVEMNGLKAELSLLREQADTPAMPEPDGGPAHADAIVVSGLQAKIIQLQDTIVSAEEAFETKKAEIIAEATQPLLADMQTKQVELANALEKAGASNHELQELIEINKHLEASCANPAPSPSETEDGSQSKIAALKDELQSERQSAAAKLLETQNEIASLTAAAAGFEEQSAIIDSLRGELSLANDELKRVTAETRDHLGEAIRELEAKIQQEKKNQFTTPGTQITTFILNDVLYEVICDEENPLSIEHGKRLRAMVGRFRENHAGSAQTILTRLSTTTLKDRVIIDLTGVTDPDLVADVSIIGDEISAAQLEKHARSMISQLKNLVWNEKHDVTKLPKYDCVMQEMHKKCMPFFRDGWDQFDGSPLSQGVRSLWKYLRFDHFDDEHDTFKDPRVRYQAFCTKLNEVCVLLQDPSCENEKKDEMRKIVHNILKVRWTGISLDGYLDGLVDHVRSAYHLEQNDGVIPSAEKYDIKTFGARLREINDVEIKLAPSHVKKPSAALARQKLYGEVLGKDFTGTENTPAIRSVDTFGDADGLTQSICYVRNGCPTAGGVFSGLGGLFSRWLSIGDGHSGEFVVPNFKEFLVALNSSEEPGSAFITTHQQYDGKNENTRVAEVMKLQSNNNCAVLVQPIGQGELGKKIERYETATTLIDLKKAIMENFFADKIVSKDFKRCQLPDFIKLDKAYEEKMAKIIDFVANVFFPDDTDFSSPEKWQQFLLIFYTYQRIDLMFRFQEYTKKPIKYCTTFCKDFLDRGGIVALTHASILAMYTNQFGTHEWMNGQVRHVVGPPLLVKRQEMIPEKLAIYEPLHARLAELYLNPERMELFKSFQFADKWFALGHDLATMPHQQAKPDISKIRTLEEMRERLRWMQEAGRSKTHVIKAEELMGHLGQGKDVPPETPVHFNQTVTTAYELLTSVGDKGDKLRLCLALAMNGIMDGGRAEMKARLNRDDLRLSDPKNLRIVITADGDQYNIQMRYDHNYQASKDISIKEDSRFETEKVKAGHTFATIQTCLGIDYNIKTGSFKQGGSFEWKVQDIK